MTLAVDLVLDALHNPGVIGGIADYAHATPFFMGEATFHCLLLLDQTIEFVGVQYRGQIGLFLFRSLWQLAENGADIGFTLVL